MFSGVSRRKRNSKKKQSKTETIRNLEGSRIVQLQPLTLDENLRLMLVSIVNGLHVLQKAAAGRNGLKVSFQKHKSKNAFNFMFQWNLSQSFHLASCKYGVFRSVKPFFKSNWHLETVYICADCLTATIRQFSGSQGCIHHISQWVLKT